MKEGAMAEAKDEAGGRAIKCSFCLDEWADIGDGRFFVFKADGVAICEMCVAECIACAVHRRSPSIDQALSVPTAESEPAPVAEAPERVTHTQAAVALQAIAERPSSEKTQQRLELLELYRQQQEQSEREVVSLQMRLGEALGMLHEADGHNTQPATWDQLIDGAKSNVKALGFAYEHQADLDQEIGNLRDQRDALRTQLTDAERKAEGLRVELETMTRVADGRLQIGCDAIDERDKLKAKLAESERKLGEASVIIERLEQMLAESQAKEPAGVEAGKAAEASVKCRCSWPAPPPGPGHSDFCPQYMPVELETDPTPIDTEADHLEDLCAVVTCDEPRTDSGYCFGHSPAPTSEPSDPAPPKPGNPALFPEEPMCPHCGAPNQQWPKPGADPLTKLVAALQAIRGNYGGATHCFANDLIRELEREGGAKP